MSDRDLDLDKAMPDFLRRIPSKKPDAGEGSPREAEMVSPRDNGAGTAEPTP